MVMWVVAVPAAIGAVVVALLLVEEMAKLVLVAVVAIVVENVVVEAGAAVIVNVEKVLTAMVLVIGFARVVCTFPEGAVDAVIEGEVRIVVPRLVAVVETILLVKLMDVLPVAVYMVVKVRVRVDGYTLLVTEVVFRVEAVVAMIEDVIVGLLGVAVEIGVLEKVAV